MPYLGFIRNGRLSCLRVGSVEAATRHYSGARDEQRYAEQVRVLDEQSGNYWRLINGNWTEFTAEDEDYTVEEMVAELGLYYGPPTEPPKRKTYTAMPPVQEPEPVIEPERPRETIVDMRTYTRGRARREGRRKR